jgi:hypothetical protein
VPAVATGKTHEFSIDTREPGAVVIYGRGGDLGDFGVFADSLVKRTLRDIYGSNIEVKHIERKKEFLECITDAKRTFLINELHVFSHSFGVGLSLAYEDPDLENERRQWIRHNIDDYYSNDKLDELYDAIISRELGILFVDDLFYLPDESFRDALRRQFHSEKSFVKIWGCNSGVEDWTYASDSYWGALNYKHVPKMSIARAFANACAVKTFGARAGSHVEVLDKGKWITSDDYKNAHGRYPSSELPQRLQPDKGDYVPFSPDN